jgi:hypothetical protein
VPWLENLSVALDEIRRKERYHCRLRHQALDLEGLAKECDRINAEALEWQDQMESIDDGKYADLIAVS